MKEFSYGITFKFVIFSFFLAPKMSSVYDNVLGFNKYTTWKSDVILLQDIDFAKLGGRNFSFLFFLLKQLRGFFLAL